MRLAALQMQAVPGDQEANFARIVQAAHEAAGEGASLLVTPELALSGYGAGEAGLGCEGVTNALDCDDGDAASRVGIADGDHRRRTSEERIRRA